MGLALPVGHMIAFKKDGHVQSRALRAIISKNPTTQYFMPFSPITHWTYPFLVYSFMVTRRKYWSFSFKYTWAYPCWRLLYFCFLYYMPALCISLLSLNIYIFLLIHPYQKHRNIYWYMSILCLLSTNIKWRVLSFSFL